MNAPRKLTRKWYFYYDIGHNNGSLTILCHVVYAALGLTGNRDRKRSSFTDSAIDRYLSLMSFYNFIYDR